LRELLQKAGFRVLKITYNNFFIFPLAAPLILIREKLGLRPKLASPHFDEEAYQVEMEPAPPLVNAILSRIGELEAWLIKPFSLPFGTSIIALAHKL
jgi:hypothetical protein